jgi:hypothetical protein
MDNIYTKININKGTGIDKYVDTETDTDTDTDTDMEMNMARRTEPLERTWT